MSQKTEQEQHLSNTNTHLLPDENTSIASMDLRETNNSIDCRVTWQRQHRRSVRRISTAAAFVMSAAAAGMMMRRDHVVGIDAFTFPSSAIASIPSYSTHQYDDDETLLVSSSSRVSNSIRYPSSEGMVPVKSLRRKRKSIMEDICPRAWRTRGTTTRARAVVACGATGNNVEDHHHGAAASGSNSSGGENQHQHPHDISSAASSSSSPAKASNVQLLPLTFNFDDYGRGDQYYNYNDDEYYEEDLDDDAQTSRNINNSNGGLFTTGRYHFINEKSARNPSNDYDNNNNNNNVFDYDYGDENAGVEDPEIDGSVVANGSTPGLYAPEVNKWTTLMTDGTNAALHRPGKEMTFEEGMEILYNDLKDLSSHDNDVVESYWNRLMPTVSYLGTSDAAKVKQALRVAYRAHLGQARKSGEPYIIHPVEVALLLSGMKMDAETVMSGLLHDTVEDTDLTFEQVEAMFGHEVRNIVEGETKVSKLPKLAFADYADEQAENLRQMFVAMTDDYRIIIVKLADRLHNMRTLSHMKPEKQLKISRETLDIFAPLAHRMGLWPFKSELEDIAFMYLYPLEYAQLNFRLLQRQGQFRATLGKSIEVLEHTLKNDPTLQSQDVEIEVVGRTKELYSLWHKMEMKRDRNLDHITDLVAVRVILTPGGKSEEGTKSEDGQGQLADSGVWQCYHVLGLVQHLPGFQPMPTKVKDYISFPKPNGYQSLHTALMYKGQSVEVQIRTSYMHQVAEYGMASHFAYKDEMKRSNNGMAVAGLYNTPWLSSIKEWQQDSLCSRDFVDSVRRELLGKRVFVFLRNGKILNLARGATAVDAAFQIHTNVGLCMHGVEINGKPVRIFWRIPLLNSKGV